MVSHFIAAIRGNCVQSAKANHTCSSANQEGSLCDDAGFGEGKGGIEPANGTCTWADSTVQYRMERISMIKAIIHIRPAIESRRDEPV